MKTACPISPGRMGRSGQIFHAKCRCENGEDYIAPHGEGRHHAEVYFRQRGWVIDHGDYKCALCKAEHDLNRLNDR